MASSFPRKPAGATLLPSPDPRAPVRVAIVEDDADDCRMMTRMLKQSQEFVCAGVYGSAKDALEEIPKVHPQVVLMDIRLPGMSGIECAWRLKLVLPGTVVIFVTALLDSVTMSEAFKAGGVWYLPKPFSLAQFLAALRFAVWQRKENRPKRKSGSARKTLSLTQREKAVMDGLASGLLYKEMAEKLKCSHAVIKKLQHSAFHKLGVTKNTEAVRRWLSGDSHEAE